jgi:DNA excision repair protein ERCC-2
MVNHSSEIKDLRLNIAVFFPSYRKLDWFLENITLPKHLLVIRERAGMVQEELMQLIEDFKSEPVKDGGKFAIMAGVMGGRFAEGIDFPGQALSIIVIAGIPYPVPGVRQEALQHYYDKKFNNRGWEFTVRAPAIRKILQAAGRAIRSKTDKGFIVIADLKAGGFQDYIPDLEPSDNLIAEISEFFEA